MSKTYRVTWQVTLSADNPVQAAMKMEQHMTEKREFRPTFAVRDVATQDVVAINLEYISEIEDCDTPISYWGSDSVYRLSTWLAEVRTGYTRLGYWEWVEMKNTEARRKQEEEG